MSKNNKGAIVCNLLIALLGILGIIKTVYLGAGMLIYFTILSNILAIVSSLLYVIYLFVKKEQSSVPFYVVILRFMSSVCLSITMLTVLTILSVTMEGGYITSLIKNLTDDGMLYHHLLCPLLSIISFIFFEGDRRLNKKKTIYFGMLPFTVYAVITIVLNITKTLKGPYPFLLVYEQPVYVSIIIAVVMFVAVYLISRFLLIENQKHAPRIKRDALKAN